MIVAILLPRETDPAGAAGKERGRPVSRESDGYNPRSRQPDNHKLPDAGEAGAG
jgi:hypothetical protein